MKQGDIFTCVTPNGAVVRAVVVHTICNVGDQYTRVYLCYSQNRLFTFEDHFGHKRYGETVEEYCVIPKYDELLSQG